MLVHPQEAIIHASALLLTPKGEFKESLRTEALHKKIHPTGNAERPVDEEVLYNHSVALLMPTFHGQEELSAFIDTHYEHIFHSLLLAWPYSLEAFRQGASEEGPDELFHAAYYFYLVNLLDPHSAKIPGQHFSITTIRPRKPCLEWIHTSGIDELEDLALDIQRKHGVAILTPSFHTPEQEEEFREKHCSQLWDIGLGGFCEDATLWPEERTYEKLLEWFHCETCYPVVDLTRMRLNKK